MFYSNYKYPNADYYGDDLRELVRLYKELTDTYNGLQKEIADLRDYIDNFRKITDEIVRDQIAITMSLYTQRLLKVEEQVKTLTQLVKTYDDRFVPIEVDIESLKKELRDTINYFRNLHQELLEEFHEYKNGVGKYIDGRIEYLEQYIKDTVTKLDRLDVINPINHKFEDINKALEEIYKTVQYSFGIKAGEYDKMRLTAWEYDRRKINAIDYSTKGYFIFWELRQGLMTSPFTGLQTHYSKIIQKLADLHKCTFTAKQYDNLNMTALDYDGWDINAFNYDWYGRQMILQRRGITAEEFDEKKWTAYLFDNEEITASRFDVYGYSLLYTPEVTTKHSMSCNPDVLAPIPNKRKGIL